MNHPKNHQRTPEDKRLENHSGKESIYKLGKHRSNALELVHKIAPIEVDGEMAICDGGGGALGHPLEYISLARPGTVEYCKYCALRYTQKQK
jgi:NADH dehydrogenase (ubiquinone) Fe-S protein 6